MPPSVRPTLSIDLQKPKAKRVGSIKVASHPAEAVAPIAATVSSGTSETVPKLPPSAKRAVHSGQGPAVGETAGSGDFRSARLALIDDPWVD